mmetsp:Transcript_635/g.1345  ORF Transcript_635/g.1345 Transcript_635/m.1345 type:complete len:399 (-) Transcript_635:85-1281(-)
MLSSFALPLSVLCGSDALGDLLAHLAAADGVLPREVRRAQPVVEHLVDGALEGLGGLGAVEVVAEHHGGREDGGEGVGLVLSGDIRRGPVARLEHARPGPVPDRRRRQHAERAHQHGGLVGEDVAEDVARHDNVELLGVADELHGGVVHVHVAQLDLGVLGVLLDHHVPPQLAHVEHVGLVHAAHLVSALGRDVEGHLGDPPHLALLVAHVVEPEPLPVLGGDALGLPEVDVARQLAHDHDVHPRHHLGLEGGRVDELRQHRRRTQVREQAERLAHAEEAGLWPQFARILVPLRSADGGKEDRVTGLHLLEGHIRQRIVVSVKRGASDQSLFEVDRESLLGSHSLARNYGRFDDLWPNAIAREQCHVIRVLARYSHARTCQARKALPSRKSSQRHSWR